MKQNICSIQGCGKVLRSKGLCHTHYTRQRIHGDPLGGSTFKGEPFRFYKEVALHHEGEDTIAKRLGICPQAVSAIQRGKWWAWL